MSARADLLGCLGDTIVAKPGRLIVAVDGVDGAGKTTFADELVPVLESKNRTVLRASVDGFHNPRMIRNRRGKGDPEGFFLGSYNYADFRRYLLDPFRAGATSVDVARYDHTGDAEIARPMDLATQTVLLIDGIFLHRDELHRLWDFSIFLSVPFAVSYGRMAERDGSISNPLAPENRRYYEGQQLYLNHCKPMGRATVVVDNSIIDRRNLSKRSLPSFQ